MTVYDRSPGGLRTDRGIFRDHLWHLLRIQAGLGTNVEFLISRTPKERLYTNEW